MLQLLISGTIPHESLDKCKTDVQRRLETSTEPKKEKKKSSMTSFTRKPMTEILIALYTILTLEIPIFLNRTSVPSSRVLILQTGTSGETES